MKNDTKAPIVAKVDLARVKYEKPNSMGIDFMNEIDIWAKMEFKFRNGTNKRPAMMKDLNSLHYCIREKLD